MRRRVISAVLRVALLALFAPFAGCGDGSAAPERVAEVRLDQPSLLLRVGATQRLTATTLKSGGIALEGRRVAWRSSDQGIATVSATGDVTALAPGTARVTASSEGRSAEAAVTVTLVPVQSVTLDAGTMTLLVGQARLVGVIVLDSLGRAVQGRAVTWRSGDEAVATMSAQGELRAVGAGATTVIASVEGREDTAVVTVQPRIASSVAVSHASLVLAPALPFRVAAEVRDQSGAAMAGEPLAWRSADTLVATVAADGLVTGVGVGSTTVVVSSGPLGRMVAVDVLPGLTRVAGRLVTAGDGAAATSRVALQLGASRQEYATTVAADGSFALDAPIPTGLADSATIVVDALGSARTHRAIHERILAAAAVARLQRPLLVPAAVALSSGTHAGATPQPVSLEGAFTRVCTGPDINCNSFFPRAWLPGGPILWAEAQFPIPVAFNHAGSSAPISAADSAALWTILRRMEEDLGRPLFRPAMVGGIQPIDAGGFAREAIVVVIDGTLAANTGFANWQWTGNLDMLAARVRMGSANALRSAGLVSHEFLHALGFHHSCAWGTVMGGYGCPIAPRASRADAAGFALAYQVRRAVLAQAPTTGLQSAWQGERLVELGFPFAMVTAALPVPPALRTGGVFESGAP